MAHFALEFLNVFYKQLKVASVCSYYIPLITLENSVPEVAVNSRIETVRQ